MANVNHEGKEWATACLVVIGNELLSGKVTDVNVPFLTKRLFALGIEVLSVHILPDHHQSLVAAVRDCSAKADYVFTTGGLGPTHDDVTLKAVAEAMNRKFVHSPSLEALLEKLYNLPQGPQRTYFATIPEGAELIHPPESDYPQMVVGNVYLFPGVPEVVRKKFELIVDRFVSCPIFTAELVVAQSELSIVGILNRIVYGCPDVKIGSYPGHDNGAENVRLTFDSRNEQSLKTAVEMARKELA
jgi:molybdenum cofactor synthesis domain-containing protein